MEAEEAIHRDDHPPQAHCDAQDDRVNRCCFSLFRMLGDQFEETFSQSEIVDRDRNSQNLIGLLIAVSLLPLYSPLLFCC